MPSKNSSLNLPSSTGTSQYQRLPDSSTRSFRDTSFRATSSSAINVSTSLSIPSRPAFEGHLAWLNQRLHERQLQRQNIQSLNESDDEIEENRLLLKEEGTNLDLYRGNFSESLPSMGSVYRTGQTARIHMLNMYSHRIRRLGTKSVQQVI